MGEQIVATLYAIGGFVVLCVLGTGFAAGLARLVEKRNARPKLPPRSVWGDFPKVPAEAKAAAPISNEGEGRQGDGDRFAQDEAIARSHGGGL